MIFLTVAKNKLLLTLGLSLFFLVGVGGLGFDLFFKQENITVNKELDFGLEEKVKKIFAKRNKALLEENTDILEKLYNKEIKTGMWAYEHELNRMQYLHQWSTKQGVKFKKIASQIVIDRITEKEDGHKINLAVSTEYTYGYPDALAEDNSFRTGTYHSLNLMPQDEELLITKEWYRDPFADSLHLDKINDKQIRKIILSKKAKNLSDLNPKRVEALEYVDQYCGSASPSKYNQKYNPQYKNYNYQGGDCANFTSQMLYEAGGFKKNRIWNYNNGAGTRAWVNAHAFNRYMLNSVRASLINRGSYERVLKSSYQLLPGDYIAYQKKGKVVHISIVTGVDSNGYILVNSHNSDRHRVPWDLGWSNREIKFCLVRVHY
ncbi:amidase domain-containing protein [Halanaerobacter jeridensis]|uniref:Putative amidase domain-containing protein n=1 Tax=Halanaerobacter jeridensis TaxID=706427 RepID=A0A938XTS7_9FIRM|nr:amidase domain-containing protein [Halanaerobacter jeridensis]MBM7556759.1 hypothetical protein [Halanaerobacter jeridensis]